MGKATFGITVSGSLMPWENVIEGGLEPLLCSHMDLFLHDVKRS